MSLEAFRVQPDAAREQFVAGEKLAGNGPSLVFLHGMTSTRHGTKSDAVLDLARDRGLGFARIDFRGHGESDGEFGRVTMTDLVDDVQSVVEHMGPSVLVGSSMGGLAAAWCTARKLENIAALVLLSPALGFLPAMARQAKEAEQFELVRSDDTPVSIKAEVLADARRFDEATLPGRIQVPLLVVHGSDDKTVPAKLSDAFCHEVPHADKEFWLIEGGSHSLHEEAADIVARIATFLSGRGLI